MNVLKVVHSVPILHSSVAHYSDFGAQYVEKWVVQLAFYTHFSMVLPVTDTHVCNTCSVTIPSLCSKIGIVGNGTVEYWDTVWHF